MPYLSPINLFIFYLYPESGWGGQQFQRGDSPATLQRKLISAACIRDLVLSVAQTIGEGGNVDRLGNQELSLSSFFATTDREVGLISCGLLTCGLTTYGGSRGGAGAMCFGRQWRLKASSTRTKGTASGCRDIECHLALTDNTINIWSIMECL